MSKSEDDAIVRYYAHMNEKHVGKGGFPGWGELSEAERAPWLGEVDQSFAFTLTNDEFVKLKEFFEGEQRGWYSKTQPVKIFFDKKTGLYAKIGFCELQIAGSDCNVQRVE